MSQMRLAPPPSTSHPTSHTTTTFSAPSAPGVHDTLRSGLGPNLTPSPSTQTVPTSNHPLETRLAHWRTTQENLKLETLRRTFGMAEPIRRGMELKIAREGEWRPAALGGCSVNGGRASVSEDILLGRDEACDWEEVFTGEERLATAAAGGNLGSGFHEEVERRVGMAGRF